MLGVERRENPRCPAEEESGGAWGLGGWPAGMAGEGGLGWKGQERALPSRV